jgi:hypothetical protein
MAFAYWHQDTTFARGGDGENTDPNDDKDYAHRYLSPVRTGRTLGHGSVSQPDRHDLLAGSLPTVTARRYPRHFPDPDPPPCRRERVRRGRAEPHRHAEDWTTRRRSTLPSPDRTDFDVRGEPRSAGSGSNQDQKGLAVRHLGVVGFERARSVGHDSLHAVAAPVMGERAERAAEERTQLVLAR